MKSGYLDSGGPFWGDKTRKSWETGLKKWCMAHFGEGFVHKLRTFDRKWAQKDAWGRCVTDNSSAGV